MSTNYYLKSIAFENFRGLGNLSIPKFHRINLIGGFNGTGKSTLLEAIFAIADRRSPMVIGRQFMWRRMPIAGRSALTQLFTGLDDSKEIRISAATSSGLVIGVCSFAPPPAGVAFQLPGPKPDSPQEIPVTQATTQNDGVSLEWTVNGALEDANYSIAQSDGLSVNQYRSGTRKIPTTILMTALTKFSPGDDAARYSTLVKENRLRDLLDVMEVIRPGIKEIQLLHENGSPVLYARTSDRNLFPISFLGDGVQTILSISLAIMHADGGMLLLDEFDSAIHYSILPQVWAAISKLANAHNCQIFAATHSRECISAAYKGLQKSAGLADLQYVRLETKRAGARAVVYDHSDLQQALDAEWEVR